MPIQTKDLQWSWSLTYAYNKGRIKRISNALQAQNLGEPRLDGREAFAYI